MKRGYQKFYTTVLNNTESDVAANKIVYARYELEGRRVLEKEYPKAELYAHQQIWQGKIVTYREWSVTEGKSGLRVTSNHDTMREAVYDAQSAIEQNGGEKSLMKQVRKMIRKLKSQNIRV